MRCPVPWVNTGFGRHDGKQSGKPMVPHTPEGPGLRAKILVTMKDEVSVKRKRLASLICDIGLEGDGFCPQRALPVSGSISRCHIREGATGI